MTKSKSVLVITSQVVRGRVGARGAVFAIERLGFPVWLLPTITLPFHPGHGRGTRIVPSDENFDALIQDLANKPWLADIGAVMTGYLGSAQQAEPILRFIQAIRKINPDVLYCCDPVIGDAGGLYVPSETAVAIRDVLLPEADLITPNRFEFDWLSGKVHSTNEAMIETARELKPNQIAITTAHPVLKASRAVLFFSKCHKDPLLLEHPALNQVPNGTGDLFAALLTARLLQGLSPPKALEMATASVFDILHHTVREGQDELALVAAQDNIVRPSFPVSVRSWVGNAATQKGIKVTPRPLI